MTTFDISRLNTSKGIFRIVGINRNARKNGELEVSKIEMMNTDGWVELDLTSSKTTSLITQIEKEILIHLSIKHV